MSQQHAFPIPPPPPPESTPYFSQQHQHQHQQHQQQRRPQQPPSITTNFLRTQGVQSHSPAPSAGTAGHTPYPYSPATPGGYPSSSRATSLAGVESGSSSVAQTPRVQVAPPSPSVGMAHQQPYNPRQWSGHGAHMAYAQQRSPLGRDTREVTGMETAMPSPPPPYSPETPEPSNPPRGVRPSPMLEQGGFVSSPLAQEPSSSSMPPTMPGRGSPQMPMSPAFPPPPGQVSRNRERSASGQRLFNTISNLTGRGKQPVVNDTHSAQNTPYPQGGEVLAPPAARRAASTGHIHPSSSTTPPPPRAMTGAAVGRSSPEGGRWQPGMPLPGPPPGPPPPGTRSQSLNRYPASSSRSNSVGSEPQDGALQTQPQPQRRAAQASTLGPVPPTPADWVDGDDLNQPANQSGEPEQAASEAYYQPLRINTGAHRESSLSRRPATRDMSAQGLRERRSKSRAAREGGNVMSPVSDDSRRGDVLFSPLEGSISQRREHGRKASGFSSLAAATQGAGSPMGTPPPAATVRREAPEQTVANVLTPPYTPAVGNQLAESSHRRGLAPPSSASSDRPLSHLLHAPNEDTSQMPAPLSPARPPSSGSMKSSTRLDPFFLQAMERHRAFIEKEASAATDEERLELFANYLVHESRVRRDRYQAAYNAMAGEVVDLTRDMWRSYSRTSKRGVTPSTSMSSLDPAIPSWASESQPTSAHGNMPSSASSMGDFTPATDTGSMGDAGDLMEHGESRQWGEQFKPSLSPIPSMAVSTVPDDDSRGRTASRWWEKSDSGSIGRPDRIEKSHRETKYMGVNPALLQTSPQPSPDLVRSTPTPNTAHFSQGPHDYPPEKTGWHDAVNEYDTPIPTPARPGAARAHSSSTPYRSHHQLDLSRLITLPPPYPRHHPAVSNSHPALSSLRQTHRLLADHTEINAIRDAHLDRDFALSRASSDETKNRRARLRASIQGKINNGTISFADAARAEADFDTEEAERGRAGARAAFDDFEAAVSHPLNNLLTSRLELANKSFDELCADLDGTAVRADPNRAQEEGDEHPERLEKLTLLKWLFEAREALHREVFELHGLRGERYSEVVLTPYRIARQSAKIDEATAFFARDALSRQENFARESLGRFDALVAVVERNVTRGVEDQLSAFWDIAPGLLEVVSCVPTDEQGLGGLEVMIPAQEFEENPMLGKWPLQYLVSLLGHARKSAYQFIEAQVNLLCLMHEVRGAREKAKLKVEGGDGGMEGRLDRELKDKVAEVERLWDEALGVGIEGVQGAVRGWLERKGGWSEELEG